MHPRSTVLQMGAGWILKRGGVGYPGAYQEQGRDPQEDKKQRNSERRKKLLARGHYQGKRYEKPFARKKTTT